MEERTVTNGPYPGAIAAGSSTSAVSWAAIIAGAVVATAITLVLGLVVAGIDLASVSGGQEGDVSATSAAAMTAIGLIVTQWVSAAIGGYMAGRLRTRWIGTHTHEVFFRDTAHGFIAWALASVLIALLLTSSGASLIGASARGAVAVASSADTTSKAAAVTSLLTALSMVVGAFIASVSAALGGRLRDLHP